MSATAAQTTPGAAVSSPDGAQFDAPSGALRELAVRSGAYLAGREAAGMVVRLVGLVVVVRAIGPSEFGIYSAAAVFVSLASITAQMGAEVFLIRLPGPLTRRSYDEVFTFLLCASIVVVLAGLGLTYLVAPLLRPAGVMGPLRVLLLSIPVNVLWAPGQAYIERKFAYRRMGALELGGDVLLYATAVPMALTGFGAWSLVAGFFAMQAWLLVGSFVLSGLRPRLAWSSETWKGMLRHGTGYSLFQWIVALKYSVVTLIVASFAGAAGVGYVSLALRLNTTLNFTERGVQRVGMVAITKARSTTKERLAAALEEGSALQLLVAAAPFAAFGLVAPWVVPVVFGHTWLPALPVYALVSVASILKVPASVQRVLLLAYGWNYRVAVSVLIDLVGVCAVTIFAVRAWGILGFGIASLMGAVATVYTHYSARKIVPVRYGRLVVPLLGLVPPVLVPLVPKPWGLFLLIPPALMLLHPATRREVLHVIRTVGSIVTRGRAGSMFRLAGVAAPAQTAQTAETAHTAQAAHTAQTAQTAQTREVVNVGAELWNDDAEKGSVGGDGVEPDDLVARGTGLGAAGLGDVAHDDAGAANGGPPSVAPPSVAPPPAWPASTSFDAWRRATGVPGAPDLSPAGSAGLPGPEALAASGGSRLPAPPPAGTPWSVRPDPVFPLLGKLDALTGFPSAAAFLTRVNRILPVVSDGGWQLLVAAIDVRPSAPSRRFDAPPNAVLSLAAAALRAELRFDDPAAHVGPSTFVVAVPFVPGHPGDASSSEIAAHLQSAVASALTGHDAAVGYWAPSAPGWAVRMAHITAVSATGNDAERLVRQVVEAVSG